jgi:cell division protein FtsI/penicillin-binding protein 2
MLAVIALLAGLVAGAMAEPEAQRVGRAFANAWQSNDRAKMYALLSSDARKRASGSQFSAAYRRATDTATLASVRVLRVRTQGAAALLEVAARTRAFGTVRGDVVLPIKDGGIEWRPNMTFPGVPVGKGLTRQTRAPARANILARDGRVIAPGPAAARSSPLGVAATSIAGAMGQPIDQEQRDSLSARGFPAGTLVGTSGLERLVEHRVAGTPGGLLFAGGRVLASSEPKPARPVRTTIDLRIQEAAVTALAGRYGGIAALDPRTARVRALAGIAFSGPQPPGSTFKIITATAALEARLVTPSTDFPVETKAVIDGVDLENANAESCGGSFAQAFAHSCNSVFAPLGVRVGAKRLVATAERFGFNEKPQLSGALPSTMPPAQEISSPLAVGSTAVGQGKVLATPLELASVAQTIAANGVRTTPSILPGERGRRVRVTSRRIARQLERLMIGVVAYGTGTAASLAPVKVAGKTGTAELTTTVKKEGVAPPVEEGVDAKPPGYDTDAWFTAYAPVRRPKLVVCALFVHGGAGGTTAAPAARLVLQAGLR